MGRLKIAFPYLLFLAMAIGVYWSNVRGATGAHIARTGSEYPVTTNAEKVGEQRLIDPVCKMDVNPAWGFTYEHDGQTLHFCAERCRDDFAADPKRFFGERCMVCAQRVDPDVALEATYIGRTYYLCSPEHRAEFKVDPAGFFMHRMWGIPDWLYYISIATLLLVSFLMFEGASLFRRARPPTRESDPAGAASAAGYHAQRHTSDAPTRSRKTRTAAPVTASPSLAMGITPTWNLGGGAAAVSLPVDQSPTATKARRRAGATDRIDLMSFGPVSTLLRSRVFRFVVQLALVTFFLTIIAAGLFGNQNPGLNIAPILTWTVWWGGLVVLIMFAGKAWCYMCPWDAIAGWMERLSFWRKKDDGLGLNLRWPHVVRNISIATILFVGLTWVELGFGVTMRPAATAYIALAMLLMAIVSAFLFDRKSFCRYGCLVGRISGLYALFSGVEVRHRDRATCRACRTNECYAGTATAYGCPTFEHPGTMSTNTYCIQCGECLQTCPHDNLAVNLRPWGEDLKVGGKPRHDEAYLALLMLALTGFHGLTMTPVWQSMTASLEARLAIGRIASFSLGMLALMAFPVLIYTALVWLSYAITTRRAKAMPAGAKGRPLTYLDYFVRYAYCVLPIALFYHLAHNLEHLLMEGQKVIALLSDPFGWGWNLFGTARWIIPPLVSLDVLWILQVILVAVGHVYSLWAANKISRRIFTDKTAAAHGQWPMLIGMIAFSIFSLWLLKQPMEMRTSAM
jgi:YHS domain-containing protein/ferredoxin